MRTFFRVRWIHRVLSLEPKKHFPDLVSTFPVNFHVKWLLWHVDVHFDCAGSYKVCGAVRCSGIFPVNFRIKQLLWHVDVHFDCAGSPWDDDPQWRAYSSGLKPATQFLQTWNKGMAKAQSLFLRGEAWHGCFFTLKAGDLLLLPGHLQLALLLEPGPWCADGMLLRISVSEMTRTDLTDLWQGQTVWGHYSPNSGYGCHDAGLIPVLCSLAYWLLEDDLKSLASTRFRRHNMICHVDLLPRLWYGKVRKVFCFCLCFTHCWTSISSSSPAARNFGGKRVIRLFCLDLLCFLV